MSHITAEEETSLRARAAASLSGKSRSHVDDALVFARVIVELLDNNKSMRELFHDNKLMREENKLMFDNLTATQTRCTQLLGENRSLRGLE